MRIAILIYVLAALVAIPNCADAFSDYDVDWTSNNSKESILRITIDNCTTKFTVKNEDLEKFRKSGAHITDALKKAIERANSGCKN